MPRHRPPASANVTPRFFELKAGTRLWRVHRRSRSGVAFNPVQSDQVFGGNRFDSTPDDPYAYLYAAPGHQTALLETLARGLAFDDRGWRLIRRAMISGYQISAVEPTCDLRLVSLLDTADLAAACQDEWLIHSPPSDYPLTRRWGQWLRSKADKAQGFIWASDRDIGGRNIVLFGDRCPEEPLRVLNGHSVELDDIDGAAWLREQLAPFRITVRPPAAAIP
jgi:RES domain